MADIERAAGLPACSGSYAILLALDAPTRLAIGRLGGFDFPAGRYLYLGSAYGPGGLRARIVHHLRKGPKPHWHLDYLRAAARIEGAWTVCAFSPAKVQPDGARSLECLWSQALASLPGASIPAPGFGASDCRAGCPAHCVAFPAGLDAARIEAVLQGAVTKRMETNLTSSLNILPANILRIDFTWLADR